ncbi:hypothetical protein [Prevotella histicola]|uniref:hypothetical protein n=1 Tax=Prevotella histicola TaxID=470565 RepID=UPI001C5CD333|nr:hypothetical protein [Prevotella histicola]
MGYTTTKDDRNDSKCNSSHWLHLNPLPVNAPAFIIKKTHLRQCGCDHRAIRRVKNYPGEVLQPLSAHAPTGGDQQYGEPDHHVYSTVQVPLSYPVTSCKTPLPALFRQNDDHRDWLQYP